MTEQSFSFLWSPWSLSISVCAMLAILPLSFFAWKRTGYRRSVGLLELLRVALVGWATILLNQPEITERFLPEEQPAIVVIGDVSPSMDTRDILPDPDSADRVSRKDAIRALLEPEFWDDLEQDFSLHIRRFGGEDDGLRTDIGKQLASALEEHPRLAAIVLASDGDWNDGAPPVQAATRLRMKQVPVYAFTAGSQQRLPDVELVSFDAPTIGVAGKAVRIPYTVDSSLPVETNAVLTLSTSEGDEMATELRISPMGRTSDTLTWEPRSTGDYELELTVEIHPTEINRDNNRLRAPIVIQEEKLRVLLIESYPRWEYRYLRNALSRDPGVELSCLLFHPRLSKVGGGSSDYIKTIPDTVEELGQYDVVFLGDVGMEEGQLSPEQCRLIKGIVQHQASGLVFMPGWQGRQISLLESELGELYPVVLDTSQPEGWGSRTPGHLELTATGKQSLLTRLTDDIDENADIWNGLPGFQWHAAVIRAKPGTETLSIHRDAGNQYGRFPLLVTRTFGTGKILFMGTDGAWRWRKGVEDLYHYRFWGQVVRWMAYQRNMAAGESMRLYYSPERPRIGQTMSLSANVMRPSGEPLQSGNVTARVVAPNGQAETMRMQASEGEWGHFAGRFVPTEPGSYQLTLACQETGALLDTSFVAFGDPAERPGKPARPNVLQEIARVTRGKHFEQLQAGDLIEELRQLPDPQASIRRVRLWSHPLAGGIFIALAASFWIGRKAIGMI